MSGNLYGSICDGIKDNKDRSLKKAVVLILFFAGILLLVIDYRTSNHEIRNGILRNEYGGGTREEQLQIRIDGGERKDLEIEISEKMYKEEEVKALFQRCIAKLEKQMLGKNKNMDRVENDLNLLTNLQNEPVEISWKLDNYDVMNVYGQLQEDNLTEEGTLVNLEAVITYTENQDFQTLYQCAAMVYPKTLEREDDIIRTVKEIIKKADSEARTKERVILPESVQGSSIEYFYRMNSRGIVLLVMAVVIGILFCIQGIQNKGKEQQSRKTQMLQDYPEIINKLTLFLGAGMNVKRAFRKIIQDYEVEKHRCGLRYAYEEMKITCREMESGMTETESYERFGKRCNIQEYIRLGALLSQNIRKGTKGLSQILRLEAIQAFENRKSYAKKAGEEAGTKLLVPMFLMLAIVLLMVTIPAFLSMKI